MLIFLFDNDRYYKIILVESLLVLGKLEFSINLAASKDRLMELAIKFEDFPSYLPQQLKSIKIIERTPTQIITQEKLLFSTILKKEIEQQSIHRILSPNLLETEIVSGPAKGTIVKVNYEKISTGTKVTATIDLKISIKYKFLVPLIKKWYKMILTGILYKMNAIALNS